MKAKFPVQFLILVLLAALLSACGPRVKLIAPEIAPPSDLIPGYVPEGFELIKGYQISVGEFEARYFSKDNGDCDKVTRLICYLDLPSTFFDLKSPAGNDILGIHYQKGNQLLLITKSYYPDGSLDLWRTAYEGDREEVRDCKCDCACPCRMIAIGRLPFPLRHGDIREVRMVGGTPVAVVDQGLIGTTTVFMRGDYLLTVESGISLEENLKVVTSLLNK